jgi:8-oxo-dGTP pyrophosphatase MutT (NUDIX family)
METTVTDVQQIRSALSRFEPRALARRDSLAVAAVAAIVRDTSYGAELLMIQRAERSGDPWSGHMGLPGGRAEPGDDGSLSTAIRETHEEVGIDLLEEATLIGRLSDVPAVADGRPVALKIVPYVFQLESSPEIELSHEVTEVVWVPMAFLAERANRSSMWWQRTQERVLLPCYRYEGYLIWGLTLVMLDELLGVVSGS